MKFFLSTFRASLLGSAFLSSIECSLRRTEQIGHNSRKLEINRIAGYQPTFDVSDEARIDLDQKKMEELVLHRELNMAKEVFLYGGNSKPYAKIVILDPAGNGSFPAGSHVWGNNPGGIEVMGKTREDVKWTVSSNSSHHRGNVTVEIDYNLDAPVLPICHVGALRLDSSAETTNCFNNVGTIELGTTSSRSEAKKFNYTYNIHSDNLSGRTLKDIVKESGEIFRGSRDFEIFEKFYGQADYAERWVMAAADGGATGYKSGRGDADFSQIQGREGRGEGLLKGSAFLGVYMYVLGKLESAVKACESGEPHIDLKSLDEAVAYYAGSLADQSDDDSTGIFMFALANNRATNFKTAGHLGDKDEGTAYVNVRIMAEFKKIQSSFKGSNTTQCTDAGTSVAAIANLMKIPIIQSVLAYSFVRDREEETEEDEMEKAEAKGATYSAAILPYIYECNSKSFEIIYEHMRVGSETSKVSYSAVKGAFENVYDCLGVTCHDVGGIWDGSQYVADSRPCGLPSEKKAGSMFGKIFGFTFVVVLVGFIGMRLKKRKVFSGFRKSSDSSSIGTVAAVSEIS